jgi:hypothetical protein
MIRIEAVVATVKAGLVQEYIMVVILLGLVLIVVARVVVFLDIKVTVFKKVTYHL